MISNIFFKVWASQVVLVVTNPPASAGDGRDTGSVPGLGRPLVESMATHSSILAGEFHGQRSLAGYSPLGRKESDTTQGLSPTMTS